MLAKDLMTSNPACVTIDTPLQQVAHLMVECDCGEIPVVDGNGVQRPVGVVTDRDIVTRVVALAKDPLEMTAGDVMTSPAVTAKETDDVDTIKHLMETRQIRRVPVVSRSGEISGIVSLADIARRDSRKDVGDVVRHVSIPAQ